MSDGPVFTQIDANELQGDLLRLLCRTAREKGRIEITNCGGGSCILISKEELDSLERALEILYNANGGKRMSRSVEDFVSCAMAAE